MSGKSVFILTLILCAVGLAYTLASRLSSEAINVLVGVMCGIAASVPVSLGLLVALTRRRDEPVEEEEVGNIYPERIDPYPPRTPQPPYPPIIVVAPPQGQLPQPYGGYLAPGNMHEPPVSRDFRIIGEEEDDF